MKIPNPGDYLAKMDAKYPNRHKEIHKGACKYCPSKYPADPEAQGYKDHCSKEYVAKELLFVCAWRPNKLCKGLCDFMEIDQEYLDTIVHKKDGTPTD